MEIKLSYLKIIFTFLAFLFMFITLLGIYSKAMTFMFIFFVLEFFIGALEKLKQEGSGAIFSIFVNFIVLLFFISICY